MILPPDNLFISSTRSPVLARQDLGHEMQGNEEGRLIREQSSIKSRPKSAIDRLIRPEEGQREICARAHSDEIANLCFVLAFAPPHRSSFARHPHPER